LPKLFLLLAMDVASPIVCLLIRTPSFAMIEPEARLILTVEWRNKRLPVGL